VASASFAAARALPDAPRGLAELVEQFIIARVTPEHEGRRPKSPTDSRRLRLGRLESLAALAGGISHELSNLAASVLMSAQVFEGSSQDEASRQVLASLDDLARRLQHAGRQLHWLARGVAGEPTVFQPQYLLADVQKLVRVAFPPTVTVITRYPPDLWPLAGEPLLVFQLLLALCLEARDHLIDCGTLVLEARNEEIGESAESGERSGESGKRRPARAAGGLAARNAPPGRYVVLEAVAASSEPAESGAGIAAKAGSAASAGDAGDRQRPAATGQPAAASRRRHRKASEASRAARASGGFTEPLHQGRAARGRRAYLPAALIGEPEA
jgi:signal transduction histidine kinase